MTSSEDLLCSHIKTNHPLPPKSVRPLGRIISYSLALLQYFNPNPSCCKVLPLCVIAGKQSNIITLGPFVQLLSLLIAI